jgi:hypothetical protein
MRQIWRSVQPIPIEAYATGVPLDGDSVVEGYALVGRADSQSHYHWSAFPTQHGWYVLVTNVVNNRAEQIQGSTFNLGLEVATAVRRSL